MARTISFTHERGKELDAKITRLYDKGVVTVRNFANAIDDDFKNRVQMQVSNTLERAWKDRQDMEEDWELFKALYDLVNLDTSIRGNVSVHVPEVVKAVDVRVRELMLAIFSRDSWARAIGTNTASVKKAPAISDFMLDQLRNEKFTIKLKQFLKMLVMFGTSPALSNWDFLPRRINAADVKIEDIEGNKKRVTITSKNEEVRTGQPLFHPLRLMDFVADPFCFDVQQGTFAGHRAILSKTQMLAMQKAGIYANIEAVKAISPTAAEFRRRANVVAQFLTDDVRQEATAKAIDQFEIWEVWGPFILPNRDEEVESVITVDRSSGTILRVSENPFWHGLRPYLVAQYTQDEEGGLYGRGIIEPIASLQMELDDTRNLSLIAKDLLVNPMFTAPVEADLPPERLVASPGRILPAGLQPVQFTNNTFTAFQHEAVIKADIRETISTPTALSGAGQAGAETATENVNRIQEAKNDTAELARDISDTVLVPMMQMRHALNVQYMREERVYRKLGARARPNEPLFAVIDPVDLAEGDYFYEWQGLRDFAIKGKRIGIMRQMLDAFSRFPQLNIDVGAVARNMALEVFDREDANAFFPDLREDEMLSPTEEHDLLFLGVELVVHPLDNHLIHAQAHQTFLQNPPDNMSLVMQAHLDAHATNHLIEVQKELLRVSRQQQQVAAMQPQMPPTGEPRQRGSRPREIVPSLTATQAPEAQEAQIGGVGPQGF